MSQERKLEPCPFCGNEAHFVDDLIIVYASCTNCGATGAHSSYKSGAAYAWNHRAALSATQPAQAAPVVPDGYALISVDALRAWGKLDEVQAACVYPKPAQAAQGEPVQAGGHGLRVSVWRCYDCDHIGLNDESATHSACSMCEWSGPSPVEDKCPECQRIGTMISACPECGERYHNVIEKVISRPSDLCTSQCAEQPAAQGAGEVVARVSDLFPSVRNKLHAAGFDSDAPLYTQPAAVSQGAGEPVAIEVAAKAVYEADKDMWMSGPTYADLHERDKDRCRTMARAALRCLAGTCEFAGWSGINPRTGAVEICAHTPSRSVIRDFNMRPLVFADAQPAVAQGAGEVAKALRTISSWDHRGDGVSERWDEIHGAGSYAALILAADTQPAAGADVLDVIRKAVTAYHLALDTRQHGGVAADKLVNTVQSALDMPWVQGAAIAASGRQS